MIAGAPCQVAPRVSTIARVNSSANRRIGGTARSTKASLDMRSAAMVRLTRAEGLPSASSNGAAMVRSP